MKESSLAVSNDKRLPAFIKKLWIIVNDEKLDHIIYWSNDNNSICISNSNTFSEVILPKYFKHNNWHSFVRQLNLYGFRKVYYFNVAVDFSNGRQETVWQFKHPYFKKKNTLTDLLLIRRKTSKLNSTTSSMDVTTNDVKNELSASSSSPSIQPMSISSINSIINNNNNNIDHDAIIAKIEKKLEETQHQFELMKIEAQNLKIQQLEQQKLIQKLLRYVLAKEGETPKQNESRAFKDLYQTSPDNLNLMDNNNMNNTNNTGNTLPSIANIISFAEKK